MSYVYTKSIDVTPQVFERLAKMAEDLKPLCDRGKISPSSMIFMTIQHWENKPPNGAWVKELIALMPGGGGTRW